MSPTLLHAKTVLHRCMTARTSPQSCQCATHSLTCTVRTKAQRTITLVISSLCFATQISHRHDSMSYRKVQLPVIQSTTLGLMAILHNPLLQECPGACLQRKRICSAISVGGISLACPILPINSTRWVSLKWFSELAWNMGVSMAPGAMQNTSTPAANATNADINH